MRHKTVGLLVIVMALLCGTRPVCPQNYIPLYPYLVHAQEDLSPPTSIQMLMQPSPTVKHPRVILALGGGGCKAVAEIGVLRSFQKHHVPIDGIVGTSMGSTIGALYCAGIPLDTIQQVFLDGSLQKSLEDHVKIKTVLRPAIALVYMIKNKPYAGLTDGKAFLSFLERRLPASFSELRIPFAAVATNLTDGATSVLARGNLSKSVLASNSLPVVYRPVLINGKLFVDGGLKANLPARISQEMGGDVIVSVVVDKSVVQQSNEELRSLKQVGSRASEIVVGALDREQAGSSDVLIYPNVDEISLLSKDSEVLLNGIVAGEAAADKAMPAILGQLVAKGYKICPRASAAAGQVR